MREYSCQHLIDTTDSCYRQIAVLCDDLSDEDWKTQSLCPDWTVREAIGHAVGVEDALSGWEISVRNPPPFEKAQAFTAAASHVSATEFARLVRNIFQSRRADFATLSDADLSRLARTPVGVHPYGRFLAIRIFDMWVHVRDCTIPLGRTTYDDGPDAEITLGEVERSIGYIIGKKVGLPKGMSMLIRITGPVVRRIGVVVAGRARAVDPDQLSNPDVVLTADSTTFIMLACGRIDPQTKIDSGHISWSGDEHWGEIAARNLRFTR